MLKNTLYNNTGGRETKPHINCTWCLILKIIKTLLRILSDYFILRREENLLLNSRITIIVPAAGGTV